MHTMEKSSGCSFNIRWGALIIAVFSVLCAVSSLVHNLSEDEKSPYARDITGKTFYQFKYSSIPSMLHYDIVSSAHTIVYFVFSMALLQGILLRNPGTMFPWLCIEFSETALSLTAIMLSVVADPEIFSQFTNEEILYGALFWAFGYGLEIFCLVIVYKYYSLIVKGPKTEQNETIYSLPFSTEKMYLV